MTVSKRPSPTGSDAAAAGEKPARRKPTLPKAAAATSESAKPASADTARPKPARRRARGPGGLDPSALLAGWTRAEAAGAVGFHTARADAPSTPDQPIQIPGEGHIMTIAPTGAGKGVSCVIPALLSYDGPVIVIDPKGENAAVTAERRRQMGHDVRVIDPIGVSGQKSSRFNPMDLIDTRYADAAEDAAMLATMMVPVYFADPFWSNRAVQLITGLMLHVAATRPPEERTLRTVRELVAEASVSSAELLSQLKWSPQPEARLTAAMLEGPENRTRQSIMLVTQDALDLVRGDLVADNGAGSDFSLDAVTRGDPLTIYLVLPPHMLDSHGPLMRLWVGALFAALTRRASQPKKATLLLLDEAAQLGTFDPIRRATTLMRSYGVRLWSFWQDASQLKRLYPDWETLVNNCAAVQAFGLSTTLAANGVADILGLPNAAMLNGMRTDDLALRLTGQEPRIVRRPNYRTDAVYADLAAENPFYAARKPVLRKRRRAAPAPAPPPDGSNLVKPPDFANVERLKFALKNRNRKKTAR